MLGQDHLFISSFSNLKREFLNHEANNPNQYFIQEMDYGDICRMVILGIIDITAIGGDQIF